MRVFRLAVGLAFAAWLAPHAARADAASACADLAKPMHAKLFAEILDAPTTVISAKLVPPGGDGTIIEKDFPAYCRVEGMVAPAVGFLLRMPSENWNGKMLFGGCGGPCGNYPFGRYDTALVRNYAVVVTDMGHKGSGWMFGYNNLPEAIDFGYRGTHVSLVAAKVVVDAFYGKKASRNYYWGCSTGGRQGLVEAQRFPQDFDGLVAGAPPWSQVGFQAYVYKWQHESNTDKAGKMILTQDKLAVVHKAVIEACDALDGLKDGLLMDPRRCGFDPKSLVCKKGAKADACLTEAQAEVVQKIYDGPKDSKGNRLFYGRARGSEMTWVLRAADRVITENTMANYLSFDIAQGPKYQIEDFDYDRDPQRLAMMDWIFGHTNPDLRKLKAAGAKLILFHGWDDNNDIPPEQAIDYYETVTRTMGGPDNTRDFFRLFMPPHMLHCQYGEAGGEIDWITAIENWVEKGQAPDQVTAYHMLQEPYTTIDRPVTDYGGTRILYPRHPLNPALYDKARPIYAYPDVARYSGTGDPAKPDSWTKEPR